MKTISDAFGTTQIQEGAIWGKNTQRSLENFPIGSETMPKNLIEALVEIKRAAAIVNGAHGVLSDTVADQIVQACDLILVGDLQTDFPLSIWQTGSGTQTNMNVNEVIAYYAKVHPNDDVNRGQSSNDVFPSALHIMAYKQVKLTLLPSLERFKHSLEILMSENEHILKTGRTHLQDATPISFGQEVSAWLAMINFSIEQLTLSLVYLKQIPMGATAVGTGLNTFEGFDTAICDHLGMEPVDNKFRGISSKDAILEAHACLNTLATNVMKIMNDIRWLASGPRCGLGEIILPANEAGSSIMPGKVNPTQCEAVMMVCAQVMGNQTTMSIANMSGNFQLNTFMPVMALNFAQSIALLSDGLDSFNQRCLSGITVNEPEMKAKLETSLMSATFLNSKLGYDMTSDLVNKAHASGKNIREVVLEADVMSAKEFDDYFQYNDMISPNKE